MISNVKSLFRARKAPSYAHADLYSMGRAFYDREKLRFLQQTAGYLGSTLSHREIEALLDQKTYVRS
jgi:hypothetical protein